jgi:hypothetical protein
MATHTLYHATARAPRWLAPVAVGVGVLAATATLGVIDPEVRGQLTPGCPFRALTGLDCPGCGGTRAVYALTQGDIALAFEHNVLVMLVLPLLVVAWVTWLWYRLGRRPQPLVLSARSGYTIAAAFAVFWVVRNLPWFPFTWLGSGAG